MAAAGVADTGTHTVKPGETASKIAADHGTTVEALAAANGLRDPNLVVIGSTLVIPGGGSGGGGGAGSSSGSYTVKAGDTLSSIAAASGTSVDALAKANGIADPHMIFVGRIIKLIAAGNDALGRDQRPITYTVQPGDNLSSIAARFGSTPSALAAANGIGNANVVVIGSTLRIPAGSGGGDTTGLPSRLLAHPERLSLRPTFERWAAYYGVPADLVEALAWMESGWQNSVVSSTNAVGIGQLMPETVDFLQLLMGDQRLDPTVPEHNIRMTVRFVGYLLDQTGGDVATSLAAYYQGLQSVRTRPLYDDTKAYVAVILALRSRFD